MNAKKKDVTTLLDQTTAETESHGAPSIPSLNVTKAREDLGHMWGLDRSLTRAELARALDLSPRYGGSHIGKLELPEDHARRATLSGPIAVAIRMMLDGGVPYTMSAVIKPGYPRGLK